MPVNPYTWVQSDFLTASRLNSEMYRTFGWYFQPNGTGFHAARPLYKAYFAGAGGTAAPSSGAWDTMATVSSRGGWTVTADTGGYFGDRGDSNCVGQFALSTLQNGGGIVGTSGGLGLVTQNLSIAPTNQAQIIRAGFGVPGDTTTTATGTMQSLNGSANSGPWGLDIVDLSATTSAFAQTSADPGPLSVITEADGSNQACRLQAFWASVYPGNGIQVTSLPAPAATWTGSSPSLSHAYMNGTAGIAAVMNLLNMPPLLRVLGNGSHTTVANNGTVTCVYNSVTYDTYGGYDTSTDTYTVPLNGIYLVYNCFPFDNIGATRINAGVQINDDADYWGPACATVSGQGGAAAKVQIFSLDAGDTITPVVYQKSGSTQSGSADYNGMLIVLFLGMQGAPDTLPLVPDITYSWTAGTPGSSMPGLMNDHFANDLLFLSQRPYFMGYQTTEQTGLEMGGHYPVTLDSITGIVHDDTGDNYSGWSSVNGVYTSQRAGWYLAVQETFLAEPSLTASPWCMAGLQVTPGGTYGCDFYQSANQYAVAGNGAAGVSIYYLREGDTIQSRIYSNHSSSTTTSTYVGSGYNSHFELIWLGQ